MNIVRTHEFLTPCDWCCQHMNLHHHIGWSPVIQMTGEWHWQPSYKLPDLEPIALSTQLCSLSSNETIVYDLDIAGVTMCQGLLTCITCPAYQHCRLCLYILLLGSCCQ